jgi:hypothetical protein
MIPQPQKADTRQWYEMTYLRTERLLLRPEESGSKILQPPVTLASDSGRITDKQEINETLLTSERPTIPQEVFIGCERRNVYDCSSFFRAIGRTAK